MKQKWNTKWDSNEIHNGSDMELHHGIEMEYKI
jgi:hypothetical protein